MRAAMADRRSAAICSDMVVSEKDITGPHHECLAVGVASCPDNSAASVSMN
jgi:hypothetical protein